MFKLTIYVPSTSGITSINNEKYVRQICQVLSAIYGGCSSSKVEGYYVANNGQLVIEAITTVYTFSSNAEKLGRTGDYVARWLKRILKQESVLITVEAIHQVSFV